MSPKKLSDDEKVELVRLYRETDATTATLAHHFQVSSSTVGRVLKNKLSPQDYNHLVRKKRYQKRSKHRSKPAPKVSSKKESTQSREQENESDNNDTQLSQVPEMQKSVSAPANSYIDQEPSNQQIELSFSDNESSPQITLPSDQEEQEEMENVDFSVIKAMFGEDMGSDDLEDSEEDDWEEEEEQVTSNPKKKSNEVEVLPLSQAKFPKTCYLVIDRGANLITKPLKDFNDLGKIPSVETQQKTLPVFDNHRVARRFSNRSQKVIKVPDGKMIQKTKEHLQAKGIKRILMDGKVYMLS
ncbi:hypothetical protein FRE64_02710 [Euhalothece natronophila Z-M001]|uniref:Transposase n=1 Tax=Euhalothece natronophila Z-M001 TaxID=522448 RepID=A0A5B8NIZ5_9CHRO|nr:hypothetical protein [Euhalothece natronophila]QDZ38946.1 hypothetical protein FRE64_02710 [Euhalothece natronophila Z-M001]